MLSLSETLHQLKNTQIEYTEMLLFFLSVLALAGINTSATNSIDVSRIDGASIKDAYKEMNIQLVRDVPPCDIEATMSKVKELLAKEANGRAISSFFKFLTGQAKVSQAYKLFGALSKLTEGHRCDANAINILKQNDLASEGRAHANLSSGECRKRVENVLLHYVKLSIEECPQVHADLMRQNLANFDSRQWKYVRRLTEDEFSSHWEDLMRHNVEKRDALVQLALDTERFMFTELVQGTNLYHHLDTMLTQFDSEQKQFLKPVVDEATGLTKINESKIEELFQEYAMKPCRNYVKTFGPNIFEPEIYLASFKHEPLRGDEGFYSNWVRYNICKFYIAFERKLLREVKLTANI